MINYGIKLAYGTAFRRLFSGLSLKSVMHDGLPKSFLRHNNLYERFAKRNYYGYNGKGSPFGTLKIFRIASIFVVTGGFIYQVSTEFQIPFKSFSERSTILNDSNATYKYEPDSIKLLYEFEEQIDSEETFDLQLYKISEIEKKQKKEKERADELRRFPKILNFLLSIKFLCIDYILEPCLTTLRFVRLSCIFLPVLVSYPLLMVLFNNSKISLSRLLGYSYGKRETSQGMIFWTKYLKWTIEHAGACFVKLGQWAASRTDVFSKNFCDELSTLHSNAKAHCLRDTKRIIVKSFNETHCSGGIEELSFDQIFKEFIEKPIGVGSIAQVYIGKLNDSLPIKSNSLSDIDTNRKSMWDFFINLIKERFLLKTYYPVMDQWVAIKVIHPKVEIQVDRDLKIMKFFAVLLGSTIPSIEWLSLPEEVDQFTTFMKLQMDLRIEGYNLNKFIKNFEKKNFPKGMNNKSVMSVANDVFLKIKFPRPYLELSSRQVLVEEYMHAIPISTILRLTDYINDKKKKEEEDYTEQEKYSNFRKFDKVISNEILDSFLQMLIIDNFIHSDLHPGNIFVRFYRTHGTDYLASSSSQISNEDALFDTTNVTSNVLSVTKDKGSGKDETEIEEKLLDIFNNLFKNHYKPEICYLDAGLVTELNEKDRVNFLELFKALAVFDGYRAGELMVERSRTPDLAIDKDVFAMKVEKLVNTVKNRAFTLGNISIGDLLDRMLGMVRSHHVKMEPDFVNVVVAILLLEGIGRRLDPDLDLFARFVWAMVVGLPTSEDSSLF